MFLQDGRRILRYFQTFLSLKKKTRVHRRVLAKLCAQAISPHAAASENNRRHPWTPRDASAPSCSFTPPRPAEIAYKSLISLRLQKAPRRGAARGTAHTTQARRRSEPTP